MTGPVVLDLSRLLSRATRRVPTGIDRVEHAYAETLLAAIGGRLRFAALNPLGQVVPLPMAGARRFVEQTGELWQRATPAAGGRSAAGVLGLARGLSVQTVLPRPTAARGGRYGGRPTYLLVSHHHLHRPNSIETAKRRLGAAFACFIHDLIPIEFPEWGRPHEAAKHVCRMQTAARFADALIVNSQATRESLLPFLRQAGRDVPLLVAPLGVHARPSTTRPSTIRPAQEQEQEPYFLYIGTIEPRKNHLLLFNIWRRLAETMGERTPKLLLVGQRGWENEMVLDVLERSDALRPHVREFNALPDAEVATLVAGARALLLPSFAEGYGLPVAEALAAGTPVLCSDLPALREVGRAAAEYLDPLDGLGWLAAIRDYAERHSSRRARQVERIATWSPPGWPAHVDAVLKLIDALPG